MFIGAQVSLYPMTDGFVDVILSGIDALDPYRGDLRIETDDISTLMVGPPEPLFAAMRALFVGAAGAGHHVVLSAHVSRGCPGEPDDPSCTSPRLAGPFTAVADRVAAAHARVAAASLCGQSATAQLALHPLGTDRHMDEIGACIAFLKRSGVFDRSKNFCTKLRGDAGPLFETMAEAFLSFGNPQGHAVMTFTASANSPSAT